MSGAIWGLGLACWLIGREGRNGNHIGNYYEVEASGLAAGDESMDPYSSPYTIHKPLMGFSSRHPSWV